MNLSCPATISFAAICGADYLTFLLFIQRITKKEKKNRGFLSSQMESWVLALYHGHSSRLLSENCITNSRCTASNCNCQYVSQFCSSDHDVASDCKNSMREKKIKTSTKSFVKRSKELLSWQAPSWLLSSWLYHTVDIARGFFVRNLSKPEWYFRLHFHNYFDFVSSFN